jgi:hypothetical protein
MAQAIDMVKRFVVGGLYFNASSLLVACTSFAFARAVLDWKKNINTDTTKTSISSDINTTTTHTGTQHHLTFTTFGNSNS